MSKRFKDAEKYSPLSNARHKDSLANLTHDEWDEGNYIVEQEIIENVSDTLNKPGK